MREKGSFKIIANKQNDGFVVDTVVGVLPAENEKGYQEGGYDLDTLNRAAVDIEMFGSPAGYDLALNSVNAAIECLKAAANATQSEALPSRSTRHYPVFLREYFHN